MARLRLDSVNAMDPGAPDPIGTLKEIKKLGLPALKYGSCSMPSKTNRGCSHYDHPENGPCPIRAMLRERARPGPENVGFARVKSPKVWKMDATQCFNYMRFVANDDPRNGIAQVLGIGGDYYIKRRTTQLLDKDNPKSKSVFKLERELVPKFARPDVSMNEQGEVTKLAREMIANENRNTLSTLLGGANLGVNGIEEDDDVEEVDISDPDDLDDIEEMDEDGEPADDSEDDLGDAPDLTGEVDLEDEAPKPRRGRGKRKVDDGE